MANIGRQKTAEPLKSGGVRRANSDPALTAEEYEAFFEKYGLAEEQIAAIKNNLIGIVNHLLDSYLDSFR